MEVTTIRLDDGLLDALEAEYDEYGFANRTEYIRWILRNRSVIHEHGEETDAAPSGRRDRDELAERVERLETALGALQASLPVENSHDAEAIDSEAASAGAESEEQNTMDGSDQPASRGGSTPDDGGSGADATRDVRERLRDELPGSGDTLDARVEAILTMRDELRERGEADRDDLLAAVDVEATRYADANSFWKNAVAGRDTLRALPGVERPPTGRTAWRWIGDDDPDDDSEVYDPTEEF